MSCERISIDMFNECIERFLTISDSIMDGWKGHQVEGMENGRYMTKKCHVNLSESIAEDEVEEEGAGNLIIGMEYHVAFHISYGVPVLCFDAWRLDGTRLSMEEYWAANRSLKESNMFETLTQLDHPVERRPILTLHPCKTMEILAPFLENSKNIITSWLSVVSPYVHLKLEEVYFKQC